LVAVIIIVRIVYRAEFARKTELSPEVYRGRMLPGQVLKAVIVCVGLAIAFFAGVPVATASLIGGAILLVTRAIKPSRIYREIDRPLLFMFAGLFIVVAGAEKTLLTPEMVASA
ncbi:anion transporter, partial [Mesorhizobium sp. M3A.F.Ca.ET.174.01.1.1]|uniref:SLC13 family permease n=1 Tax=Mesorhizobium sp. M3A.F.Ca.ET.174.01.1.1 TaxID=2563944 RepID=UPI001133476A